MKPLSTNAFIQARPSQKPDMICDGYSYLQSRARQLTTELRILNQWMTLMPDLVAHDQSEKIDLENFKINHEEFIRSMDELTEQIVIQDDKVKALKNCFQSKTIGV